jgi:hypothetical protein
MADDFITSLKEVGGVFKFGSGVLGKSSIALGVLLIAIIIAVSRLHSDAAIILVIVIGVLLFAGWFRYVLKFAGDHPDIALLEGAEWSGYKRFEATAKGLSPPPSERNPSELPGDPDKEGPQ